jgi:hypothetical protein
MNRKIDEAFGFQAQVDCMIGACTINLAGKGVGSAQNSLIDPALVTAGDYAVNGVIYTVAASSSVFVLEDTSLAAGEAAGFVCCLPATGIAAGVGYATNVLTSAQVSTLGGTCALVLASDDLVMPTIPATMCPMGIYVCVAGDSAHVAGSNTFSACTSDSGLHAFTQILNMNRVS